MTFGKTVFVFLSQIENVYIATGQQTYSGTGKGRQTTRIVDGYHSFSSIPISQNPSLATGSSMVLKAEYKVTIGQYWSEFETLSTYQVIFPKDMNGSCITTKNGERTVGAVLKDKTSSGSLVLLPDLDFSNEKFYKYVNEELEFTGEAEDFSKRLVAALVKMDKSLRALSEHTPEPNWATSTKYSLQAEVELQGQLLIAETAVEAAQLQKEAIEIKLQESTKLRVLLYENGKLLEAGVLDALRIIGFNANNFSDATSEFDAVLESEEGRLIGEVEGKDSKAISIEKLRQLSLNIHEDLLREEVSTAAKGILFGIGFRLLDPDSRASQFTELCIKSAQSTSIGLLATSDLFQAAKYVSDSNDTAFAKLCREKLISTSGLIQLTEIPSVALTTISE